MWPKHNVKSNVSDDCQYLSVINSSIVQNIKVSTDTGGYLAGTHRLCGTGVVDWWQTAFSGEYLMSSRNKRAGKREGLMCVRNENLGLTRCKIRLGLMA